MDDYIERKVTIEALKSVLNDPNCPVFISATVEQVLTEAPAANVREDVQGEWDSDERCSVYSEKSTEGIDAEKWNYWFPVFCPHCGARMVV